MKWKIGDKFKVKLDSRECIFGNYFDNEIGVIVEINQCNLKVNFPPNKIDPDRTGYNVSEDEIVGLTKLEKMLY